MECRNVCRGRRRMAGARRRPADQRAVATKAKIEGDTAAVVPPLPMAAKFLPTLKRIGGEWRIDLGVAKNPGRVWGDLSPNGGRRVEIIDPVANPDQMIMNVLIGTK
jgi:hypothetical protein